MRRVHEASASVASASASADQQPTSQMSFATVPVSYPCQYTSQIKQNNGVTQCSLSWFENGCNDVCTTEAFEQKTFHNKAKKQGMYPMAFFRRHWDNLAWHRDAPD